MKHLKKFTESIKEKDYTDLKNKILDKLKNGYCILVDNKNIEKFWDIVKNEFDNKYLIKDQMTNDKYYFFLIGNRLLHSDKNYIGGTKIEYYYPTF
jgi:hypothetical protein